MNPITALPTATLAIIVSALTSTAQPHAAPPQAVSGAWPAATTAPSCKLIDQATSANEDFAEAAVAGDPTAADDARRAIHETFDQIRASLQRSSITKAEALIGVVDSASAAGNLPHAGQAAIGVYRVLINAFSARLPTTLDVATLDYTGYKLQTQAAASRQDWAAINKTVDLSAVKTGSAVNRLSLPDDKALVDLATDAHAAIEAASDAEHAGWITTAAQVQLDTVDFLEGIVKNPSPDACR
jgi:hypothetical protein